jgi:hypothetical protein
MRSEDNRPARPQSEGHQGPAPRAGMHEQANVPTRDVPTPPANPEQQASERARGASGPQYRLRAKHVIDGREVPAGTLVGDGTDYPWDEDTDPSNLMEGANAAGKERVNKLHQRLYGADAPWHDERLQKDVEKDLEDQKKQREEEKSAEPVSHAQAVEMGKEWKGPANPFVQARLTGSPVPGPQAIVGDTSGNPGMARPRINQENVRPERPLEEQLPHVE